MIAQVQQQSDLVQIVTILGPIITAAIGAFIVWQQGKLKEEQGEMRRDQAKLTDHVNGHMTAMLAQKDEMIKVMTATADRAIGKQEGAQEQKAEIRVDALAKTAEVKSP